MYKVLVNNQEFKVEYDSTHQSIDGKPFQADILEFSQGKFHILQDNKSYIAEIIEIKPAEKVLCYQSKQFGLFAFCS